MRKKYCKQSRALHQVRSDCQCSILIRSFLAIFTMLHCYLSNISNLCYSVKDKLNTFLHLSFSHRGRTGLQAYEEYHERCSQTSEKRPHPCSRCMMRIHSKHQTHFFSRNFAKSNIKQTHKVAMDLTSRSH